MDSTTKRARSARNADYIFKKPYINSNGIERTMNTQKYFTLLPRAKKIQTLNRYITINEDRSHTQLLEFTDRDSKFLENQAQFSKSYEVLPECDHQTDQPPGSQWKFCKIINSVKTAMTLIIPSFLSKWLKCPKISESEFAKEFIPSPRMKSIPFVVDLLVSYVENYSMDVQGIYRICASHQSIIELASSLNKDLSKWRFESPLWEDSILISCLLKHLLRSFTRHFGFDTGKVIETYAENSKPEILLVYLIDQIAHSNMLELLLFIIRHLSKVAANSNVNNMNARSLGIVFAPLLFDLNSPGNIIQITKNACEITAIMIEHSNAICSSFDNVYRLNEAMCGQNLTKRQFLELYTTCTDCNI